MALVCLHANELQKKRKIACFLLALGVEYCNVAHHIISLLYALTLHSRRPRVRCYSLDSFHKREHIRRLVHSDDVTCIEQLRLDRHAFVKLCEMLRDIGGLKSTKNMLLDEQVAMFLYILAHHVKNRVVKHNFRRSGATVSKYFHSVMNATLRLSKYLLKKAEPIPENSNDDRWKYFKNCVGALDGTHIPIKVPLKDKPRYRTRKNEIATNVLGVCTPNMPFTYVLPGWEGSAADSRVLRDAITRMNGLKVPQGCYYLVDGGYPNSDGFLAPFRGQRYHLNEWRQSQQPRSAEELFNLRHASARNVIERCFGLLKMRWIILRSPSFYLVRIHNRVILACFLLHNFIRIEMSHDPLEECLTLDDESNVDNEDDLIATLGSNDSWTAWRHEIATQMFNDWSVGRHG